MLARRLCQTVRYCLIGSLREGRSDTVANHMRVCFVLVLGLLGGFLAASSSNSSSSASSSPSSTAAATTTTGYAKLFGSDQWSGFSWNYTGDGLCLQGLWGNITRNVAQLGSAFKATFSGIGTLVTRQPWQTLLPSWPNLTTSKWHRRRRDLLDVRQAACATGRDISAKYWLPPQRTSRWALGAACVAALGLTFLAAMAGWREQLAWAVILGAWLLPGGEAHVLSSRACYQPKLRTILFSNCCNETDVYWCTSIFCWTKAGCVVCTDVGCWTALGGGVSIYPRGSTAVARKQAMDLFGLVGWAGVLAEGLGLGELYSAGLVAGTFMFGRPTHPALQCNHTCSQAALTWWSDHAPSLSALYQLLATLPEAVWNLISAMPLVFGGLLLFYLALGRWVQVVLLLLAVPGALARTCETPPDFSECGYDTFQEENMTCLCPFGVIRRNFNSSYSWMNITAQCPYNFTALNPTGGVNDWFWTCGWGSWWWQHNNIEYPYSHPFMPPPPLSALCYITRNETWLWNKTFDLVDVSTKWWSGLITTCFLDRRPAKCGGCYGGCFYSTGRHDLGFGTCGGGYRDGPWLFAPLAIIRGVDRYGSQQEYYYDIKPHTQKLLAAQFDLGYGCGYVDSLLNCWLCNINATTCNGLHGGGVPDPGVWWPLPGVPAFDVCINPQYARRRIKEQRGGLALLQRAVEVIFLGDKSKPCYLESGRAPVCPYSAWYPPGGGMVVHVADEQVFDTGPSVLRSMLGFYIALLVYAANSGARVVPALVVFAAVWSFTYAACFPACAEALCTWVACYVRDPCVERRGQRLYWPVGSGLALADSADLPAGLEVSVGTGIVISLWEQYTGLSGLAPLPVLVGLGVSEARNVTSHVYCGPFDPWASRCSWVDLGWLGLLVLAWVSPHVSVALSLVGVSVVSAFRVVSLMPLRALACLWATCTGSPFGRVMVMALFLHFLNAIGMCPWAEAALSRAVVTGPALGWATRLPTWPEVVLGVVCVLLYATVLGRARLAALVAYKLSRGLLGVTFLLLVFGRGHDRGVMGFEICLHVYEAPFSVENTWWWASGAFAFGCLSLSLLSQVGKRIRVRLYARWCRVYCRISVAVGLSPVGRWWVARPPTTVAWIVACVVWPRETSWVGLSLIGAAAIVDLADWAIAHALCMTPDLEPLARCLDTATRHLTREDVAALLRRRWIHGEVIYQHMGQLSAASASTLRDWGATLEPVSLHPCELEEVYDDTMTLTCGKWWGGKPVVARCGRSVLVGTLDSVATLPPGYQLSAPLLVTRPPRGFFQTLRISMLGRDDEPSPGQVVVLSTATQCSMGCGVAGVLYTTFHATAGRALAGPHGPRNPYWTSPSDDVACYPLLPPLGSLDACSCGDHSRWVITPSGQLVHGVETGEHHVTLDCPLAVDKIKGASGSPVLCDKGHAVGMLVGALHRHGVADRVRFVQPWKTRPGDAQVAPATAYPTVPGTGYNEVPYIAPTGSGKSTKFPAHLAQEGHRVLVLNPSVVTTKSMLKYMKELTGKAPNVYAGTGRYSVTCTTGSKITYMTYGRFLVDGEHYLQDKDVVICDECHATDGTTILGIGYVRAKAKKAGVKLVVFSTATPPGTTMAPHKNITETPLDSDGDIPFYGLTLKSAQYASGRHVIFCHSKAECTRVATCLQERGITAVTYWRGKSPDVLRDDKNLVVVATDAISTGYTGNFVSVTDCCSVVEEDVEVDLNPTFSIGVVVRPADAALRLQRRGRTGRGAPGTYRPVVVAAPPSGVCSTAAGWAAAETGYMWYGMSNQDLQCYMDSYQQCPYTSRLQGDITEPVRVLGALKPLFHVVECTQEALKDTTWPMLTGIQRRLCLEADAAPPSDDIRWAGLRGTSAVPLLYRIGQVTAPVCGHALARKMADALGDTSYADTGVGPVLLAGAALAAAVAIAGATGSLVIKSVWEVLPAGSPTHPNASTAAERGSLQEEGPVPEAALQEVVTSLDWPFCTAVWGAAESGASVVKDAWGHLSGAARDWWLSEGHPVVRSIPVGSKAADLLRVLEANISAVVCGGIAVAGARSSPPFAALAALVTGVQVAAPRNIIWLLTLAGGLAGSLVGGSRAAMALAGGFYLGTRVAGLSWLDTIMGAAAGYEACIAFCATTLDLLDGKITLAGALPCLVGLMSPGAAAAGVALALILRSSAGKDTSRWMNRLLSMLPKSNVLPDKFFEDEQNVRLADAVRRLSMIQRVKAFCEAFDEPTYVMTGGGWLPAIWTFGEQIVRWLLSLAKNCVSIPSLPLVGCSRGYGGAWQGEGTGSTTCSCGALVTVSVVQGLPTVSGPRTCRHVWRGTFPINTTTKWTLSARPAITGADSYTFLIGVNHTITVEPHEGAFDIVATTTGTLTLQQVLRAAAYGPVAVDGCPISTYCGEALAVGFTKGQCICFDGKQVRLPHRVGRRIVVPNIAYYPRLMLDDGSDTAESVVGPAERAVEVATTLADEATTIAEATVETAGTMLTAAFEARRRAEMEAWKLREQMMGRDLHADGCAPDADDSPDHSLTNRLLYAALEDDDPTPTEADEYYDCNNAAVVPPAEEPALTGVAPPPPSDEISDIKSVTQTVTAVVHKAMDAEGPVLGALRAAVEVVRSAPQAVRAFAQSVKSVEPDITYSVPVTELRSVRTIQFAWTCCGGGTSSVTTSDHDTVGHAAKLAGLPEAHPHGFRIEGGGVSAGTLCRKLPGETLVQAVCNPSAIPVGTTVVRTLVHRCCGEDRSLTKAFGPSTPCVLLGALWGDTTGFWWDGDRLVEPDDEIGDCGSVLELRHETPCGYSYVWSGMPIHTGEPRPAPVTRPITGALRADATRVYTTQPQDIYKRIAKVTIDQVEAEADEFYLDAYNLALAKANKILNPGWSYDEAVSKVKPNSARGHVANITVADLQTPRGKAIVLRCLDDIRTGCCVAPFMLRPKVEVFPKTKETYKPPRLIVYPSLEFRVAEKMILGDPSITAKAVMGDSYGFQYRPNERADVLVKMWKAKKNPICYTLDGVCFDSTVTSADIQREGEIFARASADPDLVRKLHAHYAEGPMMDGAGRIVGVRRCRASGTLTTSAGNSITCYLKVTAACRKAGIPNPSFLIHGDDVVVIAEKTEDDRCDALAAALRSYGYDCVPTAHADLTTAESCSASLDVVRTVRGQKFMLRCDMRRGLGRTLAEFGDPVGTAWGYTINYPTHPIVMYVLLPVLLSIALNNGDGPDQRVTVDIRGNTVDLPLHALGSAIKRLHGRDTLAVVGHSAVALEESYACLAFFKMRGLGHWRRYRRKVRVRMMRAGPVWAKLARELLWDPSDSLGPDLSEGQYEIPAELWTQAYEGLIVRVKPRVTRSRLLALGLLAVVVSMALI
uniref:Genome polyprotein n=1 Tax=Dremomys pernyi pegivirus TaxID=3040112 RepID=A0AAT9TZ72_9FLAV|nr:polyprotein [Dremomys pernyi pegivirus]